VAMLMGGTEGGGPRSGRETSVTGTARGEQILHLK
jgi:hypothetical protein